MKDLAPEIFRKRLMIEGFFNIKVDEKIIKDFLSSLTEFMSFKTYGEALIHNTGGIGKQENQGYDAFVPLIDSGIYLAVWSGHKFLSLIIYTCKDFDDKKAIDYTRDFFTIHEISFLSF